MNFGKIIHVINLTLPIIVLSIIFSEQIFPQISTSLNYSLYYDDNPFRQIEKSEEMINMFNLNLDYQPVQNKKYYISYSGGVNSFNQNNEYSYQFHSFGTSYNFNLGDSSLSNATLGGFYSIKSSVSSESIFDYNNYSFYGNAKIFFNESFLITPGYIFTNKNYKNISDLNFSEHLFFLRISKFFESKTGLIFEPNIGYKKYSIIDEYQTAETYYGQRRRWQQSNEHYIGSSKSQARFSVKLSQGIFEQAGMNIHYLHRMNLSKNGGFNLNDYFGTDDEDLWDDPYNFEGNEFGSEFTQNFPYEFSLKLSGKYSSRMYDTNLSDSVLVKRKDKRTEVWFGITKSISVPVLNSLDLTLEYMFINNKSNGEIFNYKNNLMMLSTRINF